MPKPGQALPKSEVTRQLLLDAAIEEIVVSGPDKVSFTAIAKRAGMSTGALYARYENSDELVIDIWVERALPGITDFARAVITASVGSGEELEGHRKKISHKLDNADATLTVAVLIMIVSRRNEALLEVVNPTCDVVMRELQAQLPVICAALAHYFGILLLIRGAGLGGLHWAGAVGVLSDAIKTSVENPVDVPVTNVQIPTSVLAIIDEFENVMFRSVCDVIGRVGVENATIARIARMAQVNPATVYTHYENKDDLLIQTLSNVLESAYQDDSVLYEGGARVDSLAQFAISMFRNRSTKEYAPVAQLRLELLCASGNHDDLRTVMNDFYEKRGESDLIFAGIEKEKINEELLPYVLLYRAFIYGVFVLSSKDFISSDDKFAPILIQNLMKLLGRTIPTVVKE